MKRTRAHPSMKYLMWATLTMHLLMYIGPLGIDASASGWLDYAPFGTYCNLLNMIMITWLISYN
jgi:hypothetical protein